MNDRKLGVDVDGVTDSDGNKHIGYYLPDVLSTTDYYAFGAEMPGRQGVPAMGRYRFGFNGMERDGETPLDGNSYTTDFRQYDPRLGRWLAIDPIVKPWESPYAAMFNNPIGFSDPTGLDPGDEPVKIVKRYKDGSGTVWKYNEKVNSYLPNQFATILGKMGDAVKNFGSNVIANMGSLLSIKPMPQDGTNLDNVFIPKPGFDKIFSRENSEIIEESEKSATFSISDNSWGIKILGAGISYKSDSEELISINIDPTNNNFMYSNAQKKGTVDALELSYGPVALEKEILTLPETQGKGGLSTRIHEVTYAAKFYNVVQRVNKQIVIEHLLNGHVIHRTISKPDKSNFLFKYEWDPEYAHKGKGKMNTKTKAKSSSLFKLGIYYSVDIEF